MVTVAETAGSVTVCVSTNVTLNGTRTASAVMHTVDVTSEGNVVFAFRFITCCSNHSISFRSIVY